jgi:hypothetical protein
MIEAGTKGPREQAKRDQKGGAKGMRDRGANGPGGRGNREASKAAISARRTGSQEPKAAFSLSVLSFLYSLLADSARQARGRKPGAGSFFSCSLFPVPLFPCSLPGPPATGLRRWGGLFPFLAPPPYPFTPTPPIFLPHPLPPASLLPAFPLSVPLLPWSLVHCFLPTPHTFRTPPPMPFCETVKL